LNAYLGVTLIQVNMTDSYVYGLKQLQTS